MLTNLERIQSDIEALSNFNATRENGLTRFSLTEADRGAREYLKGELNKLGIIPYEDAAGNLFGRLEGTEPTLPVIMIGSHFDSVKNGGNFDGPAGVVMGLEILRVISESEIELKNTVEFAALIEEEGGRFGAGLYGSRAMTGVVTYEELMTNKDSDGISMSDALSAFGFDPKRIEEAKRNPEDIKAFIELHIEQGPVLEREAIEVGIVKEVVGIRQLSVKIVGRPDHAGTTPMHLRCDALQAAAEVIAKIPQFANATNDGTVATVGVLNIKPCAANIVPGVAEFTVDIRSKNALSVEGVHHKIESQLKALSERGQLQFEIETLLTVKPTRLAESVEKALRESSEKLGISYKEMSSGAGHDAMIMASVVDTGLIFVPSKEGRSHCKEEWTDYDALQKGIEVICHTVIALGRSS